MILVSGYYVAITAAMRQFWRLSAKTLRRWAFPTRKSQSSPAIRLILRVHTTLLPLSRFNPLAMIDAMGHSRILISGGGSLCRMPPVGEPSPII